MIKIIFDLYGDLSLSDAVFNRKPEAYRIVIVMSFQWKTVSITDGGCLE
jgi:hypothetical protein